MLLSRRSTWRLTWMTSQGVVVVVGVAVLYQNPTLGKYLALLWALLLAFLTATILFVNYYIGQDLRKSSPLNEHLAYVNDETQNQPECLHDLDHLVNPPHGLGQQWQDQVEGNGNNNSQPLAVLITGVTGYVGKAFLFQLLREITRANNHDENNIDNNNNNNNNNSQIRLKHKVYVVTRPKNRKKLNPAQRLEKMKREDMFVSVQQAWEDCVVAIESGDLQEPHCGMSPETLQLLAKANISHVVHCAADVNFYRPLHESAGINITPVLQLQALAQTWPSCRRLVHVSTAFVNPHCGTPHKPNPEQLFPLEDYEAQDLYESMKPPPQHPQQQNSQHHHVPASLAAEARDNLRFPNNYVFTKCVAEHLIVQRHLAFSARANSGSGDETKKNHDDETNPDITTNNETTESSVKEVDDTNSTRDQPNIASKRKRKRMELVIIRPAIVGPAWILPEPGWNGDKPSTITALLLLWGTRVIRFAPVNTQPIAMVPVDVVAVGILNSMIMPLASSSSTSSSSSSSSTLASQQNENETSIVDNTPNHMDKEAAETVTIRNLTWSHQSTRKFLDGMHMVKHILPVGVLKHHFTATEAAVSFALVDLVTKFPFLFSILHHVFNLGLLKFLQILHGILKLLRIKSVLDRLPITKLLSFSNMLPLYQPYLARPFFFESSFQVPPSLDIHQYCISLLIATHTFWTRMFPGTIEDLDEMELMPRQRVDLWWALTCPSSTFRQKWIGYLSCKIIRLLHANSSVKVDFSTVYQTARTLVKLEQTHDVTSTTHITGKNSHPKQEAKKHCVVLVPTHRSLMDYILAKYIAFSMVGLGLDVPIIFADPELKHPNLAEKMGREKSKCDRNATFATFLQDSPSSDGRLQPLRTPLLQALLDSQGNYDYTLIPLNIDYDYVNPNHPLIKEFISRSSDLGLWDMFRLYWRIRSNFRIRQKVQQMQQLQQPQAQQQQRKSRGDIRVSFGVPTVLNINSDLDAVCDYIHHEHRRLTTVSEFQLAAAEQHLGIPVATLRTAMEQLDASKIWRNSKKKRRHRQTDRPLWTFSPSSFDMWRLHLQWIPRLAPLLAKTHPTWAQWIVGGDINAQPVLADHGEIAITKEIEQVMEAISLEFDDVDAIARRATQTLQRKQQHEESASLTVENIVLEMVALDKENSENSSSSLAALYEPAASFALANVATPTG